MKKIILLAILFLFKVEISNAEYREFEILNYGINDVIKMGYKITFVNNDEERQVYYTLEKDNDVILCHVIIAAKKTWCYKP